jgi:mannosyltransferase
MQTDVFINDIRAIPIAQAERKTLSLDGLIVSGLMFLTVLLSLLFISQSLRLDEAQSLWQTSGSLERMFSILAEDVHMPLYHTLLYGWQQLLGPGVEIARLLSLIFLVLTIPAIYYLARNAYSRGTAIFAATIAAVSPFLNWYGNEIRMYS